jgi:hypothetical protein
MGRQQRTPPSHEGRLNIDVLTRASSTVATIANYGLTVLTTNFGTDFVMAPPVQGCVKELSMSQATTGVFVRANVAGVTAVKFGTTGATVIEFDAAGDKYVRRVGLDSTSWIITGSAIGIAPVSTAIVIAGS